MAITASQRNADSTRKRKEKLDEKLLNTTVGWLTTGDDPAKTKLAITESPRAKCSQVYRMAIPVVGGRWEGRCLSLLGLLGQNVMDWVAHQQQRRVSHSLKAGVPGHGTSAIWKGSFLLLVNSQHLLAVSSQLVTGARAIWGIFFIRTWIPFMRVPPSPPKAPPPNTSMSGISISMYEFERGGTNIQTQQSVNVHVSLFFPASGPSHVLSPIFVPMDWERQFHL